MIRPVDLPLLRAELSQHLRSEKFASGLSGGTVSKLGHPVLGEMSLRKYGGLVAEILDRADLFFVTQEMADLARVAAESLPPIGLDEFDPPAKTGFIFFQGGVGFATHGDPPVDYRISALSWREARQGSGIAVDRFTPRDEMLEGLLAAGIATQKDVAYSRERMPRLFPLAEGGSWIPYGADNADEHTQRFLPIDRAIRSAWLLMQQPLATNEPADYRRTDRRRMEREKVEPKSVRVISLRRAKSSQEHGESDREYHHQWIVRGHWRQQYYPSREVHRPVWIAPHIKGPEGAPMLGGEKVYAWTK